MKIDFLKEMSVSGNTGTKIHGSSSGSGGAASSGSAESYVFSQAKFQQMVNVVAISSRA